MKIDTVKYIGKGITFKLKPCFKDKIIVTDVNFVGFILAGKVTKQRGSI